MTSYYTRAKARGEQEDVEQGDSAPETTTTTVSDIANVGLKDASTEGLESMSTEVAGPMSTHPQLLPEGDHSSVGGHGTLGVCQLFPRGGLHPGVPQWTCRPAGQFKS